MLQRTPIKIYDIYNSHTHFHRRCQHYNTIIIGSGHSGLITSYLLRQKKIRHVVLEKNKKVGSSWYDLPDDFVLAMPITDIIMPGFDLGHFKKDHHLTRDEMIALLNQYTVQNALPVQYDTLITAIQQNAEKNIFYVTTSQGQYSANNVVICTGPLHEPSYPHCVKKINRALWMHSADYKNADSFPIHLPIVVVGSGISALMIAYQLKKSERQVILACGYNDDQVKEQNKHLFYTADGLEKENVKVYLPSQLEKMQIPNYGKLEDVTEEGYLQFSKESLPLHMNDIGKLIFATGYTQNFPFLQRLHGKSLLSQEGMPWIPGLHFAGIPTAYTGNRYAKTVTLNQGSLDAAQIVSLIENTAIMQQQESAMRPKL